MCTLKSHRPTAMKMIAWPTATQRRVITFAKTNWCGSIGVARRRFGAFRRAAERRLDGSGVEVHFPAVHQRVVGPEGGEAEAARDLHRPLGGPHGEGADHAPGAGVADERGRVAFRPTEGPQYTGNSTSQSLKRSSPVETDYLNGEIVLAARLLGRDAPANRAVTERVHRARREGTAAGTLGDEDLIATLPQLVTPPLATPPRRCRGLEPGAGSALVPGKCRLHLPSLPPAA